MFNQGNAINRIQVLLLTLSSHHPLREEQAPSTTYILKAALRQLNTEITDTKTKITICLVMKL